MARFFMGGRAPLRKSFLVSFSKTNFFATLCRPAVFPM
jgi:hypothetical protein